jgi:hypothetical protein
MSKQMTHVSSLMVCYRWADIGQKLASLFGWTKLKYPKGVPARLMNDKLTPVKKVLSAMPFLCVLTCHVVSAIAAVDYSAGIKKAVASAVAPKVVFVCNLSL